METENENKIENDIRMKLLVLESPAPLNIPTPTPAHMLQSGESIINDNSKCGRNQKLCTYIRIDCSLVNQKC